MERSWLCLSSLHSGTPHDIVIGRNSAPGMENPKSTYFCINVEAVPVEGVGGKVTGEPVHLSLILTIPQIARIVKEFFYDLFVRNFFMKILKRLLAKRWAVMTDPFIKDPHRGGDEYAPMAYHR